MNISFTSRPDSAKMRIIEEEEGGADGGAEGGEIAASNSLAKPTGPMAPSDTINEQLKEYNARSRTKHDDYEPP
jgi:hypothetical protein